MIRGAKMLLTADDLAAMGDRASRKELQEGELVDMSPAGGPHGEVALNIGAIIRQFVREHRLGKCFAAETGFVLFRDPDTVRAPDFAYVSATRLPGGTLPPGYFPGPPDLAVEVLSPSESRESIQQKTEEYFAAGSAAVWVVDPAAREVRTYTDPATSRVFTDRDELSGQAVLPGFTIPVREFFDS